MAGADGLEGSAVLVAAFFPADFLTGAAFFGATAFLAGRAPESTGALLLVAAFLEGPSFLEPEVFSGRRSRGLVGGRRLSSPAPHFGCRLFCSLRYLAVNRHHLGKRQLRSSARWIESNQLEYPRLSLPEDVSRPPRRRITEPGKGHVTKHVLYLGHRTVRGEGDNGSLDLRSHRVLTYKRDEREWIVYRVWRSSPGVASFLP